MPSTANRKLRDLKQDAQDITVWLGVSHIETTFWCIFCRKGIIQHKQRIIAIVQDIPGNLPLQSPPISVQCASCGAKYHFQGFL